MARTAEALIKELLGAKDLQIAALAAKVEALEEELAKLKAMPPSGGV